MSPLQDSLARWKFAKLALFDIDPGKAPGADGMTVGFYQKYWETVGDDVTIAVQSFF